MARPKATLTARSKDDVLATDVPVQAAAVVARVDVGVRLDLSSQDTRYANFESDALVLVRVRSRQNFRNEHYIAVEEQAAGFWHGAGTDGSNRRRDDAKNTRQTERSSIHRRSGAKSSYGRPVGPCRKA